MLLFGLGTLSDSFIGGLILLLLGIGIAGSGIQTILRIEKAGTPYHISVPFFEKEKMQLLILFECRYPQFQYLIVVKLIHQ